jgi:hypothetical protein
MDITEFQTVQALSGLALRSVNYNSNKLSKVENEKVMFQVKPSILTDREKI